MRFWHCVMFRVRLRKLSLQTLISDVNLDEFWKGTDQSVQIQFGWSSEHPPYAANGNSTFVLPCSEFDPLCGNMTTDALVDRFDLLYQPARFYPNMESALSLFSTKTVLKSLVKAYNSSDVRGGTKLALRISHYDLLIHIDCRKRV